MRHILAQQPDITRARPGPVLRRRHTPDSSLYRAPPAAPRAALGKSPLRHHALLLLHNDLCLRAPPLHPPPTQPLPLAAGHASTASTSSARSPSSMSFSTTSTCASSAPTFTICSTFRPHSPPHLSGRVSAACRSSSSSPASSSRPRRFAAGAHSHASVFETSTSSASPASLHSSSHCLP